MSSAIVKTLFAFFLFGLLSACSQNLLTTQTGYLKDYSKLETSEKFENTKTYIAPSFKKSLLANSRKIKIDTFEIWLDQQTISALNPAQLTNLSLYFRQRLTSRLRVYYRIMTNADENTLTIRGAFSGLKFKTPQLSVSDLVPIRIILNAGNAAYLLATDQKDVITEVSIEAEFIFGTKGHRVFAMTATKQLDLTLANNGQDNVKAIKKVLDIWIDNFVKELQKI